MTELYQQITQILASSEEPMERLNRAFSFLYPKIRSLACSQLRRLPMGQTITPTVLVNECFVRMASPDSLKAEDTQHFINTVAKSMRHYLVDVIRRKNRCKNASLADNFPITQIVGEKDIDFRVLELDKQLHRLHRIDPDLAQLVEWRFFTGLTLEEIAALKNISTRQVARQWKIAKSILLSLGESPLPTDSGKTQLGPCDEHQ
jgi:RNA polymerase sigma factor (TIGR02999 family)